MKQAQRARPTWSAGSAGLLVLGLVLRLLVLRLLLILGLLPGMADVVSPLDKGLGALSAPCAPQDAAAQGWNLLREDLGLPAAMVVLPWGASLAP